ncbi:MAG TPA: CPCC family cysteine-rich protein [Candidatus Limnocylindrales bacterium]|nr:CPCC family cysteine-rich protein [Candidatus Limnocylindrales bacterium]
MIRDVLPCACCGQLTILGEYDRCPVCYWVADRIQESDPTRIDGANRVSLIEAQANYRTFGAAEQGHVEDVRRPAPGEIPTDGT